MQRRGDDACLDFGLRGVGQHAGEVYDDLGSRMGDHGEVGIGRVEVGRNLDVDLHPATARFAHQGAPPKD